MTITLGWWLLPLAITVGLFLWSSAKSGNQHRGNYGYGDIGGLFDFAVFIIVSLVAWLVWAVLT